MDEAEFLSAPVEFIEFISESFDAQIPISIIIITKEFHGDKPGENSLTSLPWDHIQLSPYTEAQLRETLRVRVELAFENNIVENSGPEKTINALYHCLIRISLM